MKRAREPSVLTESIAALDLLPSELWAVIRSHLSNTFDARDRVALSRVCKSLHALDPGFIVAPLWGLWEGVRHADEISLPDLIHETLKQVARNNLWTTLQPAPYQIYCYDGWRYWPYVALCWKTFAEDGQVCIVELRHNLFGAWPLKKERPPQYIWELWHAVNSGSTQLFINTHYAKSVTTLMPVFARWIAWPGENPARDVNGKLILPEMEEEEDLDHLLAF